MADNVWAAPFVLLVPQPLHANAASIDFSAKYPTDFQKHEVRLQFAVFEDNVLSVIPYSFQGSLCLQQIPATGLTCGSPGPQNHKCRIFSTSLKSGVFT